MEETNSVKKWLYLLAGFALIGVFIFVIAPTLQRQSDTFTQISTFIDLHDVETGAYVYTDLELVAQASIGARSTVEYPPMGPK